MICLGNKSIQIWGDIPTLLIILDHPICMFYKETLKQYFITQSDPPDGLANVNLLNATVYLIRGWI